MANIFTLLNNGQLIEKKEIVEGLNPPLDFMERVKSFFPEELYNLNSDSLLYKILYALLGDAGINGIKKGFLAPKLYQSLSSTNFNDIDTLFSNVVQLTRLNDEIYTYDPYNQMLTQDQWAEIKRKDAWYKTRAQDFMRGIHLGNTYEGLKLLGRAATGYECEVFERWKYLDDINSDQPIGIPDYGQLNIPEEFVIRPQVASLTPQEQRRITNIVRELKPANSVCSVDIASNALTEVPINSGTASSYNFYVQRYVTGNSLIDYSYNKKNNWIKTGEEKEAPVQAFGDRAESVLYLTINLIEASTFHVGNFSSQQQTIFSHLQRGTNTYPYEASQAISDNPDIFKFNSPWYVKNIGKDSFVINNHYPVGYFADQNFELNKPTKLFWASEERLPGIDEYLTIDLGKSRPVNVIEFEICQKPIDIDIFYYDEDLEDWQLVNFRSDVNNETKIFYNGTGDYSWQNICLYFDTVTAKDFKIVFSKRTDPFPFFNSEPIEWSVEVRNLKIAQVIASIDDFVPNSGVDLLGNAYRTEAVTYDSSKSYDGAENTYWQSQINPSKFAVESLYFDIRTGSNPSFIDEFYIDPLTPECLMHVYYSDDDSNSDNWDNKLWTPVPRHYLLKRGNFKLVETIYAKYIKLEFTKLNTIPYNVLQLPVKLDVTYRTFPSWVESYIYANPSGRYNDPLENPAIYKRVPTNITNLGLLPPNVDKLKDEVPKSILDFVQKNRKTSVLSEYQVWKNPETNKSNTPVLGREIILYPNSSSNLYQQNLVNTIKPNLIDNKYRKSITVEDSVNWIPENPIVAKPLVAVATKTDRTKIVEEKNWPDMWFMRKCRHAYKVIQAPRSSSVGYYVGIREVKFYKKDKTAKSDEFSYRESLIDNSTIEKNTFYQKDWRWTISPEQQFVIGSRNIVEYGAESFNGVAF
jgi:hypothetical protein